MATAALARVMEQLLLQTIQSLVLQSVLTRDMVVAQACHRSLGKEWQQEEQEPVRHFVHPRVKGFQLLVRGERCDVGPQIELTRLVEVLVLRRFPLQDLSYRVQLSSCRGRVL